jgi:hypothetical protein
MFGRGGRERAAIDPELAEHEPGRRGRERERERRDDGRRDRTASSPLSPPPSSTPEPHAAGFSGLEEPA